MADPGEDETCHLSFIEDVGDVETSTSAQIVFRIPPEARRVNVGIWDDTSGHVRTLVDETDPSAGRRLLSWDGLFQVIAKYAPQARMAHFGLHLTGPDGHGMLLMDLFDQPRALLQALSTNGWIVPGAADRSLFLTRVASEGGPMTGMIDPPDLESCVAGSTPAPILRPPTRTTPPCRWRDLGGPRRGRRHGASASGWGPSTKSEV
jgi:hypothetical protein